MDLDRVQEIYDNGPLADTLGKDSEALGILFTPVTSPQQKLIDGRVVMDNRVVHRHLDSIKSETAFHPTHVKWEIIKDVA